MSCEIVCKLRLENDAHAYCSNDIEQILQSSVMRNTKWHRQCYQHSQIRTKLIDRYQTKSETE